MARSFWWVARVVAVGHFVRCALPALRPLAVVCCGAAPLVAQSPPAAPVITAPFAAKDSDQLLTIAVTKAVAADPTLGCLNLAVDVVNRVAIVGGPVPDPECGPRLEALLARVPNLSRSKVSVWVAPPSAMGDPFAARVAEKLRSGSPGGAPARGGAKAAPAPDEGTGLGPLVIWPSQLRPGTAPPLLAMAPLSMPDAGIAGSGGAGPHTTLKRELPPASAAGELPAAKLARRLEAVRGSKADWANLTLGETEGVVTITGTAARHSMALALAGAIQGVEGVRRIRVGAVAAGE